MRSFELIVLTGQCKVGGEEAALLAETITIAF